MQIIKCVEQFAAVFGECRIVVTSRTYAYQNQEWQLGDFATAMLAPFDQAQLEAFVQRWYEMSAETRGMSAQTAMGRATRLKETIRKSERLKGLAERPLLLTLMASLHAWRGGSLPEKREELYSDAVDLLLDWWESAKLEQQEDGTTDVMEPSLAEWLNTDRDKIRECLNEQAFDVHACQPELHGTADIDEKDLTGGLMALADNPDARPGQLIKYLSERAGLLVSRGVGIYTFPHRTFQEYLAACHLTADPEYPEELVRKYRAEPNRWREVALLAAAKAYRGSRSTIWNLVDELCPEQRDRPLDSEAAWDVHLAGQVLVETADLSKLSAAKTMRVAAVKDGLVEALRCNTFPAIERAAAGANLARLGDPRPEVTTIDRMAFCYVPAGDFVMGSSKSDDPKAYEDEMPRHELALPAYWISRFPVTNAQFGLFCEAEGYRKREYWVEAEKAGVWKDGRVKARNDDDWRDRPAGFGDVFGLQNHPVVGITWYEALAFVRWLNDASSLAMPEWRAVLPSEAEWEKAARGGLRYPERPVHVALAHLAEPVDGPLVAHANPGQIHPWGHKQSTDTANPNLANYAETNINTTRAVGCFTGGSSPCGCEEMLGNVWEWTRSLWGENIGSVSFGYPYEPNDGRENLAAGAEILRVLRGGAFVDVPVGVRRAARFGVDPDFRLGSFGFRVVLAHSLNSEASGL